MDGTLCRNLFFIFFRFSIEIFNHKESIWISIKYKFSKMAKMERILSTWSTALPPVFLISSFKNGYTSHLFYPCFPNNHSDEEWIPW